MAYIARPWHDEETLRRLYVDERLSCPVIGKRLGTHGDNIRRWMKRFGIARRDPTDAHAHDVHTLIVCHRCYRTSEGDRCPICNQEKPFRW